MSQLTAYPGILLTADSSGPAISSSPSKDRLFHVMMSAVGLLCLAFGVWGMHVTRIVIPFSKQALCLIIVMAFLLFGAVFYSWRKAEILSNVFSVAFWGISYFLLLLLMMYVGTRRPLEFGDPVLAQIDRWMGVEVPDVMRWAKTYPIVNTTLTFCYYSLAHLFFVAILLPPLLGRMDVSKQFLVGCVVAGVIAIITYAYFRPVGPWLCYDIPTDPIQTTHVQSFHALYYQEVYTIDLECTPPLLEIPSLHTVWACLIAVALWQIRYIRWPVAVFCTLIVISTVTTGWHYLIDVIAGLATAAVAVAAGKGYLWLETRWIGSPRQAESATGLSV